MNVVLSLLPHRFVVVSRTVNSTLAFASFSICPNPRVLHGRKPHVHQHSTGQYSQRFEKYLHERRDPRLALPSLSLPAFSMPSITTKRTELASLTRLAYQPF